MLAKWAALPIEQQNHLLGLTFICAVAFIWVLASFVVQEVEAEGLSPFVLSYIANSLFVVYLPINYLAARLPHKRQGWQRYCLNWLSGVRLL